MTITEAVNLLEPQRPRQNLSVEELFADTQIFNTLEGGNYDTLAQFLREHADANQLRVNSGGYLEIAKKSWWKPLVSWLPGIRGAEKTNPTDLKNAILQSLSCGKTHILGLKILKGLEFQKKGRSCSPFFPIKWFFSCIASPFRTQEEVDAETEINPIVEETWESRLEKVSDEANRMLEELNVIQWRFAPLGMDEEIREIRKQFEQLRDFAERLLQEKKPSNPEELIRRYKQFIAPRPAAVALAQPAPEPVLEPVIVSAPAPAIVEVQIDGKALQDYQTLIRFITHKEIEKHQLRWDAGRLVLEKIGKDQIVPTEEFYRAIQLALNAKLDSMRARLRESNGIPRDNKQALELKFAKTERRFAEQKGQCEREFKEHFGNLCEIWHQEVKRAGSIEELRILALFIQSAAHIAPDMSERLSDELLFKAKSVDEYKRTLSQLVDDLQKRASLDSPNLNKFREIMAGRQEGSCQHIVSCINTYELILRAPKGIYKKDSALLSKLPLCQQAIAEEVAIEPPPYQEDILSPVKDEIAQIRKHLNFLLNSGWITKELHQEFRRNLQSLGEMIQQILRI